MSTAPRFFVIRVRETEITNVPFGHEPHNDVGRDSSRRGWGMRRSVGMNPDLRNPPPVHKRHFYNSCISTSSSAGNVPGYLRGI